jgi:hypothetical protein
MQAPAAHAAFHVVRFQDGTESDAFVRALQRFLDSPRGAEFLSASRSVEIWSPCALAEAPLELYLSDDAVAATEKAFAPVPVASTRRGDALPAGRVQVLSGVTLC